MVGYKGTRVPLFYRGNCHGDYVCIYVCMYVCKYICAPFITENMIMGAGKESKSWETTDLSVLSHCHCWIGPAWNIRNTPPRGHTWHTWVPKKYKSYIDDQNIWVPGSWNLTHSHISPIWNVGECCYAVLSFNPAALKNPSNQCVLSTKLDELGQS